MDGVTSILSGGGAGAPGAAAASPWICSKRWDLGWLVLSGLSVLFAPFVYYAFGMSPAMVAYVIMLVVGGPHVFVTFTRTNMDPRFVRRHRTYTSLAFLIPFATAFFALRWTPLFLTVFFAWASLHVLQQISYVAGCYTNRQAMQPTKAEKFFEYGLIFSCLYPFATVRMVQGTFELDNTQLLVPGAVLGPGLVAAAFVVFGFFLVGWLYFVLRRARERRLHYGKTALIGATVGATLFTPLFPNLDVAFQGINTWHCIQYLALIWYANRIRADRGELERPILQRISQGGWRGLLGYYGLAVLGTLFIVGVIEVASIGLVQFNLASEDKSQLLAYYMFGKGILLAHYYFDTFLFTQKDELTEPGLAPVALEGGSGAPVPVTA